MVLASLLQVTLTLLTSEDLISRGLDASRRRRKNGENAIYIPLAIKFDGRPVRCSCDRFSTDILEVSVSIFTAFWLFPQSTLIMLTSANSLADRT